MNAAALTASDLDVALSGHAILSSVDLSVDRGEFVGLLGPNGAGKSTLMRCLAGLTPASAGRVRILGHDGVDLSTRRRAQLLAMVPQSTDLDFSFSATEVVLMGRHPHLARFSFETADDRALAADALAQVGMSRLAEREVGTLSGGERQLVFLAKAIAQQTPILLLDEPISALDLRHQLEVLQLAQRLRDRGHAVLAALHDISFAARHCDRLVVLHDGRVVADGPPEQVVTVALMAEVYGVEAAVGHDPHSGRPTVTPLTVLPAPAAAGV